MPEDGAGVQAPAAETSRRRRPQFHAAAVDVAGAEDEVGSVRGGQQARDVRRVVGEVAVHLEDELGSVGERPMEAGDVRGAEALLASRCRT